MGYITRCLVFAAAVAASPLPAQRVEPFESRTPDRTPARRAAARLLPSLLHSLAAPYEFELGAAREAAPVVRDGRRVIGSHRAIPAEAMAAARWDELPGGGRVWRMALRSPGAKGLRVHIADADLRGGRLWLHDGGGDAGTITGPYTGGGDFWTDAVEGDTAIIEYEGTRETPPFRIAAVSHWFGEPWPGASRAASVNRDAATCHLDASCYPEWQRTAAAVGMILFEDEGSSIVCSGTLLNTRNNSGIPYFLTADHCIDNDRTAQTVLAYWTYQTPSCNGVAPALRSVPRTAGARYLASRPRESGDWSLIRLNEAPANAVFSGWDASEVAAGAEVVNIHHPAGDYKRISFGTRWPTQAFEANAAVYYTVAMQGRGIAEPGSSGSGLFSAPGILVGNLSHGPKVENANQLCSLNPLLVNFGRFSAVFPAIRDFLEDRPPLPPVFTGEPVALTSGTPQSFAIEPLGVPALASGGRAFVVTVPAGASRLELRLALTSGSATGMVRFGQEPSANAAGVVTRDHQMTGTGAQTLTLTTASTPPLRAGRYFIALDITSPNARVSGTVTATVTGPPAVSGNGPWALTSGVEQGFRGDAVTAPTLRNGAAGYRVEVPQNAEQLVIEIRQGASSGNVELYARHGQDVVPQGETVQSDFRAVGTALTKTITINSQSTPALRAGTYFIALRQLAGEPVAAGVIVATVRLGSAATSPRALTSGVTRPYTMPQVSRPTLFSGDFGFTIQVPEGATRLEVRAAAQPGADIDLYLRYNADLELTAAGVRYDHRASSESATKTVIVTPSSNPPLRAGTYYIGLAVFSFDAAATGTILGLVSGGPPPATVGGVLTPGTASQFSIGPLNAPTVYTGAQGYTLVVPASATRVEIKAAASGAPVNLYARFGQAVATTASGVTADHSLEGADLDKTLVLTPGSTPPLRAGTYHISLGMTVTARAATGSVTATISDATPPPSGPVVLTAGTPAPFRIGPVPSARLFNGNQGFVVTVPAGVARMDIQLATTTPGADVDLYARFAEDVTASLGRVIADARSEGLTGNEAIAITTASDPPLRPGRYFIGLGLFTENVAAEGTVVVRFSGERPVSTDPVSLTSGTPAPFDLPAVERPTIFEGARSFRIAVPEGATRLRIRLATSTPGVDTDLFARYGGPVESGESGAVADHSSTGITGAETIEITPSSNPPLRAGTYHIAIGLYTTGSAAAGTVTATVERAATPPPASAGQLLTSGQAVVANLPAVAQATLFRGDFVYRIDVPEGATQLKVELNGQPSAADVDLFVRLGSEPQVTGGRVLADYRSTGDFAVESIVADAQSLPPLRPGAYYIAMAVYTPNQAIAATLTATVTGPEGQPMSQLLPAGMELESKPGGVSLESVDPAKALPEREALEFWMQRIKVY